jgi:hypothetical protein
MVKNTIYIITAVFFLVAYTEVFAQQQEKIAAYNLLNYPGSDTATRNPYFRQVVAAMNPDILVVEEITSQAGVNGFLSNVMNAQGNNYSAGTFINGYDSDNAIFYRTSDFTFVSIVPIITDLRDISQFTLTHINTGLSFKIYAAHLKASTGAANEAQRALEVDSLRKVTNLLPTGTNFIVVGDFNIYKSSESAYQKLLLDNVGDDGNFIDAITMTGTWNNPAYAQYHTQSPRVNAAFGGGATGGMDDRFDMILYSTAVAAPGGITYISNSMTAFGNDGNHYNDSVNHFPNAAVNNAVANALYYATDHLPVFANFQFGSSSLPVELSLFTAILNGNSVDLNWRTESEINNSGFHVLRSTDAHNWNEIGFEPGHGNSTITHQYFYADHSLPAHGIYYYRLRQEDYDGTSALSPVAAVDYSGNVSEIFLTNYPNPFSATTTISFSVPVTSNVSLKVFDVLGNCASEIFNEEKERGFYSVAFDRKNLSPGIYFCTLNSENSSKTIRLAISR